MQLTVHLVVELSICFFLSVERDHFVSIGDDFLSLSKFSSTSVHEVFILIL